MKKHLYCLLGDELFAETYCDDALSRHDRQRIAQSPQLSERIDWKVSRALKQNASVVEFVRFEVGEGIEKAANDFESEVAATMAAALGQN